MEDKRRGETQTRSFASKFYNSSVTPSLGNPGLAQQSTRGQGREGEEGRVV